MFLENFNRCPTPDNRNGFCVPLRRCENLFTLLQKTPLNQDERIYLSRSQCGYYLGTPWVSIAADDYLDEHLISIQINRCAARLIMVQLRFQHNRSHSHSRNRQGRRLVYARAIYRHPVNAEVNCLIASLEESKLRLPNSHGKYSKFLGKIDVSYSIFLSISFQDGFDSIHQT